MATIICNNSECLMVSLFGQKLRFMKLAPGRVECVAKSRPFPDVVQDPHDWVIHVHQAISWFDGVSPRSTVDLSPCFGQTIRLRENPPGDIVCEAIHDGTPGAVEVPAQLKATLDIIEAWFVAAGITP